MKPLYVFDLGNVLIKLDVPRCLNNFKDLLGKNFERLGMDCHGEGNELMDSYEKGLLSEDDFFNRIQALCTAKEDIDTLKRVWLSMLVNIPEHRLEFISSLKEQGYTVHLLSNTNATHWDYIDSAYGLSHLFDACTLSHVVHLVKPDEVIYLEVMERTGFEGNDIIFVDDRFENRQGAERLGWTTYDSIESLMAELSTPSRHCRTE